MGRDGKFAPWEVTRVWPGGLTFYPTGAAHPRAGGGFALPPTRDAAGCTWYQHPGNAPGADQKLLADGAGGWLAHVAGDVVLVKTFTAVSAAQAAPGEAEIEIFVDGQGRYVELEEQGAYQSLPRGQTLAWPVTWIIRKLPATWTRRSAARRWWPSSRSWSGRSGGSRSARSTSVPRSPAAGS